MAELSSEWEHTLELSKAAMERAGTWEKNAECWEAKYKTFKETQPMLYLADIKKAYPSAPRQPMWDALKKERLPPRILAIFRRLHTDTSYSVRLKAGDSAAYTLKKGLREGCASPCTLYNVFHNYALAELNKVTPGISLRRSPSLCCSWRAATGEESTRSLHTLGFADDTTTIFPATRVEEVREQVKKVLGERGETVHSGKDEFMTTRVYRPTESLPLGHKHEVRMSGVWIDPDGGARMDPTMRKRAASKVWA